MGDRDRRAPFHQPVQRLLDLLLGFGIHRAGRLIEDQDLRVVQDGAGDADALAFAAGEALPALADDRVVAIGEADDEVMGVGRLGGRG